MVSNFPGLSISTPSNPTALIRRNFSTSGAFPSTMLNIKAFFMPGRLL